MYNPDKISNKYNLINDIYMIYVYDYYGKTLFMVTSIMPLNIIEFNKITKRESSSSSILYTKYL